MEVQAVLEALRALDGDVLVVSDSTYVVNCFQDRWYDGWIRRGWKNSARKPVANRDLWEPLIELYKSREAEIDFEWVKGHSGNELNDQADELARAGVAQVRGEAAPAGETSDLPAEPGSGGTSAAEWPAAKAVWVVGATDLDREQRRELDRQIKAMNPAQDILVSGLRRGTELEAGATALERGIPLAVVLPFADPARSWPSQDRERFDQILGRAEWVVTLDGDPAKPGVAVSSRNDWMQASVLGAVVVGDAELARRLEQSGLGVKTVD